MRDISLLANYKYQNKNLGNCTKNNVMICHLENDMETAKNNNELMPEPSQLHHMVEDFLTDFTAPIR